MAEIKVEMTADQQKLIREFAKQQRKIDQLESKYKKLGRAGKGAGDKATAGLTNQQKGISKVLPSIGKMATAYVGVGTAITGVTQALQFMREEQKKALRDAEKLTESRRSLAQISTEPGDLQRFQKQAARIAKRSDLNVRQAQQLVFSAVSEGFENALPVISRITPAVGVESAKTLAGQVPTLFQGQITSRESINAGLAAAAESRVNLKEFGPIVPTGAEFGRELGVTPAETFAALSRLPSKFKSPEQAATRFRAFLSRLELRGGEQFQGVGLFGALDRLEQLSPEARDKLLGESQETQSAFRALRAERSVIRERTGRIQEAIRSTGTDQSPIAQALREALSEPEVRALLERSKSASSLNIARREKLAVPEAQFETLQNQLQKQLIEEDAAGFRRFFAQIAGRGSRFAGASPELARDASEIGSSLFTVELVPTIIEQFREQLRDVFGEAAERQVEAADKLNAAADKQSGGPTGVGPREDR